MELIDSCIEATNKLHEVTKKLHEMTERFSKQSEHIVTLSAELDLCQRAHKQKDETISSLVSQRTDLESDNKYLRKLLTTALDTGLTSKNYDSHECIETTKKARAAISVSGKIGE
jgi:chromosome segregation ATPase